MMKQFLSIIGVICFAGLLLLYPETVSANMKGGLQLCAQTVIPSLFPFFVVTGLLTQLGFARLLQGVFTPFMEPLFQMRGVCVMPMLAGLLGGYPSGAKATADLYSQGIISREEGERLLGFCNNCGPAFLLSYVGVGVMGNTAAGARLLLIHVASALITGILLRHRGGKQTAPYSASHLPEAAISLPKAFTTSVTGSLTSVLNICAYVMLFRTVAALLPLPAWALGAIEMVSGLSVLKPSKAGFIMAAVITAWGGLSVHFQSMAVAGELSMRWHWLGKAIQTIIAAVLALLICPY